MKLEELERKVSELEIRIEGIKDNVGVFQDNITSNINWFYTVLGIIIALIGVVGVALYFVVKSAVKAGVEKGINDVTSTVQREIAEIKTEFEEHKSNLDEHIVQLIKNNSKIRWAKGTQNVSNNFIYVHALNGNIDWDSPITNVRIYNPRNKKTIEFELIDKRENSFSFKININETINQIEWIIVWSEKN